MKRLAFLVISFAMSMHGGNAALNVVCANDINSNARIDAWYRNAGSNLMSVVEGAHDGHSQDRFSSALLLGQIRYAPAVDLLHRYLHFTKSAFDSKPIPPFIDPAASYSTPVVVSIQAYESLAWHHPAFAALIDIAPSFETTSLWFFENEAAISITKAVMLAKLAFNSGGKYFVHYLGGGKLPLDEDCKKVILSEVSNAPLNFSRQVVGKEDNEVYKRYLSIQHELQKRFSDEVQSLSPNLSETIATMGFVRSLDAIPILADNLTICPQVSTNSPGSYVFPAAEALISIGPAIGDCFDRLKATKPLSLEESLWLRISHELYPEGLEYELFCAAATNDTRAARLLQSLPWRRLTDEDIK